MCYSRSFFDRVTNIHPYIQTSSFPYLFLLCHKRLPMCSGTISQRWAFVAEILRHVCKFTSNYSLQPANRNTTAISTGTAAEYVKVGIFEIRIFCITEFYDFVPVFAILIISCLSRPSLQFEENQNARSRQESGHSNVTRQCS